MVASRRRSVLPRVLTRATDVLRSPGFRVGFLAVAVGVAAWAVAREWETFSETAARLGPSSLLLAVLAAATNILTSAMAWRRLLAASGSPLPVTTASRIFLLGQLGKYLPGSVWAVLAQAELASDLHVPRSRTVGASTVALGMSVAVGSALALPAAMLWAVGSSWRWAPLAVVPVLVLLFHPRVLNRLLGLMMALLRRPPPASRLGARDIAVSASWTTLSWLALGAQLFVLLLAAGAPSDAGTVLVALSGYALAWVVGFVVVVAPAGAGARELVLVAVLSPVVGTGQALAVALVSRVLTTITDVGLAAAAAVASRRAGDPRRATSTGRSREPRP